MHFVIFTDCQSGVLCENVSGYLSCPCHLEGSLFTRVKSDIAALDSAPDVEIQLLNTLIGNSPETMSQFVEITNINAQVLLNLLSLNSAIIRPSFCFACDIMQLQIC